MAEYTELIKALRHCMTKEDGITICDQCPYYGKGIECEDVLHTDAAAAIEELQAEVKRLQKENDFLESTYDEFQMQSATQNALLAKQLPKRGEWIRVQEVYIPGEIHPAVQEANDWIVNQLNALAEKCEAIRRGEVQE